MPGVLMTLLRPRALARTLLAAAAALGVALGSSADVSANPLLGGALLRLEPSGLDRRAPDVQKLLAVFDRPAPEPTVIPEPPTLRIERVDGTPLVEAKPFDEHGQVNDEALEDIAHAFRASSGHQVDISPRLVEILLTLSRAFDDAPIVLISGHREPGRGTRKTSPHVHGRAADIVIRGVKVRELRQAAIRLGAGGVGLYPHFVHVDARSDAPYRWYGR
jgi:uncharacterized protein YcbK (DUF882 family)